MALSTMKSSGLHARDVFIIITMRHFTQRDSLKNMFQPFFIPLVAMSTPSVSISSHVFNAVSIVKKSSHTREPAVCNYDNHKYLENVESHL